MNSTWVTVTLKCKKCSGNMLIVPDNPTDDSIVTCKSCGVEVGRWGDIKTGAKNTVKEKVTESIKDIFRDAFKGSKGITFK